MCNEVYQKRKLQWIDGDKEDENVDKKKYNVFLKRDVIYRNVRVTDNACLVVLYLNEKCSGFLIGLQFDGEIYFRRLAIDTQYKRYSPGIVLIWEF